MKITTPQRENGHIDINNENGEQFAKLHLSGNEWQILWVVLRKTWGWQKKEDFISLTQFEESTGLSRPSVKEAIDKLVGKKVLVVKKELYINSYSFNKLYNEWIVPKKVLVGFSVRDSRVFGNKLVGKKEHTKDNIQKTITKDIYLAPIGAGTNHLISLFAKVNPFYKTLYANKTQRSALERMTKELGEEKMISLISILHEVIYKPYCPQITTPLELENKMGKLIVFLQQEKLKIAKRGTTKI